MTLRTLSIRLSAAMLFVIAGVIGYSIAFGKYPDTVGVTNIAFAMVLSLFICGWPPVVSLIVSIRSHCPRSQMILLINSLLYGVLFTYSILLTPVPLKFIALLETCYFPILLLFLIAVYVIENMPSQEKSKNQTEP